MSQKTTKWKQLIKQIGLKSRINELIPHDVKIGMKDDKPRFCTRQMSESKRDRFMALGDKVYRA